MSYRTRILTPGGTVLDAETDGLIVLGTDGLFGVLTGHEPTLAAVAAGVLVVRQGELTRYFALGDGAAEITPGTVTICTEYAEPAADKQDAEEKLETYLKLMDTVVPAVAGTE